MKIGSVQLKKIIREETEKVLEAQGGLGSDPKVSQTAYKIMRDPNFLQDLSALLSKAGLSVRNPNELIRSIMSSDGVKPLKNPQTSYGASMASPKGLSQP